MADNLDVLRSELWNCENAFESQCPMEWRQLSRTLRPGVRFCKVCQQKVYMSKTPEEFVANGNAGRCVAIPNKVTTGDVGVCWLGTPSEKDIQAVAKDDARIRKWWDKVFDQEPTIDKDALEVVRDRVDGSEFERMLEPYVDEEVRLAIKLLNTFHLSVPERKELPGGMARLSTLVRAAEISLRQDPVIPEGWNRDQPTGGIMIEQRDSVVWIHRCHEIGMGRYSTPTAEQVPSVRDAVIIYLREYGDGDSLDGIPIDFDS